MHDPGRRDPKPELGKVDRPPYRQLLAEISATERSGGDTACPTTPCGKWVRWYRVQEAEAVKRALPPADG